MKNTAILERILAAVVLGANIYGIIYFLLRSLENPEISIIFVLITLVIFGLLYRFKLLGRRKTKLTMINTHVKLKESILWELKCLEKYIMTKTVLTRLTNKHDQVVCYTC